MKVDLSAKRSELFKVFESRKDKDGPPGCYRWLPGSRTNLYASLDTAIAYAVMGIDIGSFSDNTRLGWIEHINSFIDDYRNDGTYKDIIPRHSPSHANGMVIGALGYLGGKQPLQVTLYNEFNTSEKVISWLNNINWPRQWASGFWGGPMMYSTSKACTTEWINTTINWLTENLDPSTGMWKKDIVPDNKYQPLGGFVHIYPIYELHNKNFPYADKVIESVLEMQNNNGYWYEGDSFSYLDMDALYAYVAMLRLSKNRHREVIESTLRYFKHIEDVLCERSFDTIDSHGLLCLASVYGLLNQIAPDFFIDSVKWSDIFSCRLLYDTKSVEARY